MNRGSRRSSSFPPLALNATAGPAADQDGAGPEVQHAVIVQIDAVPGGVSALPTDLRIRPSLLNVPVEVAPGACRIVASLWMSRVLVTRLFQTLPPLQSMEPSPDQAAAPKLLMVRRQDFDPAPAQRGVGRHTQYGDARSRHGAARPDQTRRHGHDAAARQSAGAQIQYPGRARGVHGDGAARHVRLTDVVNCPPASCCRR